jgi:predicted RNA-binding protein with RPS1 domain
MLESLEESLRRISISLKKREELEVQQKKKPKPTEQSEQCSNTFQDLRNKLEDIASSKNTNETYFFESEDKDQLINLSKFLDFV